MRGNPTRLFRRAVVLVPVAAICVFVASCGSPTSGPTATAAAGAACTAPPEVTVASFPVGVTLPTDIATGIGAFADVEKKCNTKINIASFDSPQPMIAGVLSGQIQFAVSNVQNQLLAAAQGQNLTSILNMAQGGNGVIIGKASAESNTVGTDAIREYPPNSIWAMTTTTGLSALVVNALNDNIGNPAGSARLVQVGATGIASQVASGGANLGYVPSPTAAVSAIRAGDTRSVLNASGPSVYKLLGFIPGWTMLTSSSFADEYPQLSAEMAAAELKGLRFIQSHLNDPAAVYDAMPDSYRSSTPKDVWADAWPWNASAYVVTGWITRDDMIRTAQLMQRYGVLKKEFDPNTLPDTILAPSILKVAFDSIGEPVPTQPVDVALLEKTAD